MASLGTKLIFLLLLISSLLPLGGQQLREGDLLFCCSDTANAITSVTSGVDGLLIDHVAVVHSLGGDRGPWCVIEAVKPSVCITPIDTFLMNNGMVIIGRVNVDCDVTASVSRCLAMVGKPYDDLFLPGDSAVYCSELVQMNYIDKDGELIFAPIPMSFSDSTGCVTAYWKEFYSARGLSVPDGEPGSNPGELSRRPQVSIISRYPAKEAFGN